MAATIASTGTLAWGPGAAELLNVALSVVRAGPAIAVRTVRAGVAIAVRLLRGGV
ncbi:MAG: hypothetical protein HY275_19750 [Gemmatimonadetes bacterium]|nr:hypothetical protein [Gemmatimonadota bacterium]